MITPKEFRESRATFRRNRSKFAAAEKSRRVPVKIDQAIYEAFQSYSDLTGVSVAHVVRTALTEYRDTVLEAKLDTLTTGKDNVIPFESLSLSARA